MDFEIGVVGVGLAGKQRFDLAAIDVGTQLLQRVLRLADDLAVAFLLAELDQADIVRRAPTPAGGRR